VDIPTVIARFREAHQLGNVELPLGERLSEALSKHDCVANFSTSAWDFDIVGIDAAGVTLYTFAYGHLTTRHLGRLYGFAWTELEDFGGDRVNPVKAFGLEHPALPEGRIEIDTRDVTEGEREELRDALRHLKG
jgi:hypothetical protein